MSENAGVIAAPLVIRDYTYWTIALVPDSDQRAISIVIRPARPAADALSAVMDELYTTIIPALERVLRLIFNADRAAYQWVNTPPNSGWIRVCPHFQETRQLGDIRLSPDSTSFVITDEPGSKPYANTLNELSAGISRAINHVTQETCEKSWPVQEGSYLVIDGGEVRTYDVYEHPVKGLSVFASDLLMETESDEFGCHVSVQYTGLVFLCRLGRLQL